MECAVRAITTPAASSERTRGRHEAIGPLSTNTSFFRHNRLEPRRYHTHPAFICCYNFGTVSPIRENSSCRPALCFVLSEETKRYCASVVPDTKTDAKLVHQLSHTEANRKVWSYVACERVPPTQPLLYPSDVIQACSTGKRTYFKVHRSRFSRSTRNRRDTTVGVLYRYYRMPALDPKNY